MTPLDEAKVIDIAAAEWFNVPDQDLYTLCIVEFMEFIKDNMDSWDIEFIDNYANIWLKAECV